MPEARDCGPMHRGDPNRVDKVAGSADEIHPGHQQGEDGVAGVHGPDNSDAGELIERGFLDRDLVAGEVQSPVGVVVAEMWFTVDTA